MSEGGEPTLSRYFGTKRRLDQAERQQRAKQRARERKKAGLPPGNLRQLERAVGGREVVAEALAHAPPSEPVDTLRTLLGDPKSRALEIRELCAQAKLTVPEFWALFKQGVLSKAQVRAMAAVSHGLPDVAADLMKRAVGHTIDCPKCFGTGLSDGDAAKTIRDTVIGTGGVPVEREAPRCPQCDGTGRKEVVPEVKRQELALEMGGLLKRHEGVSVHVTQQQQQGLLVAQVPSLFAKFQMATDKILYGPGRSGLRGSAPAAALPDGGRPADPRDVLEAAPVATDCVVDGEKGAEK